MEDTLSVSLSIELCVRLAERTGNKGVSNLVEDIAWDFLERTSHDTSRNSGNSSGIFWSTLFLPSGTKLLMQYGGAQHEAEVVQQQIAFGGKGFSTPSQFASAVANGTSRNAWRDIWIKRPEDRTFEKADLLRRQ